MTKNHNWTLNVTLPTTIVTTTVAVVGYILMVPGVFYGLTILGASYVTTQVAARRFARLGKS